MFTLWFCKENIFRKIFFNLKVFEWFSEDSCNSNMINVCIENFHNKLARDTKYLGQHYFVHVFINRISHETINLKASSSLYWDRANSNEKQFLVLLMVELDHILFYVERECTEILSVVYKKTRVSCFIRGNNFFIEAIK